MFVSARVLGLRFGILAGAWMFISCGCFQEAVSATDRSFAQRNTIECGVSECDSEASIMRRLWSTRNCCAIKKTNLPTDWLTTVWSGPPFKFRNLQQFVVAEDSLPRSQKPATRSTQRWMNQVHALPNNFVKIYFNIILQCTLR